MKKILDFIFYLFLAVCLFFGIAETFVKISESPRGWDFQFTVLFIMLVFVVLSPFAMMLATKDDQN